MASTEVAGVKRASETIEYPRKKYRVTELPLSATQRAAIDGLVHTIKKKGIYDTVRRQIWSQYNESVSVSFLNFHAVTAA